MDEMQKPTTMPAAAPAPKMATPGKKMKSSYLMPVMIAFVAIVAFLAVWFFAVN